MAAMRHGSLRRRYLPQLRTQRSPDVKLGSQRGGTGSGVLFYIVNNVKYI